MTDLWYLASTSRKPLCLLGGWQEWILLKASLIIYNSSSIFCNSSVWHFYAQEPDFILPESLIPLLPSCDEDETWHILMLILWWELVQPKTRLCTVGFFQLSIYWYPSTSFIHHFFLEIFVLTFSCRTILSTHTNKLALLNSRGFASEKNMLRITLLMWTASWH